MKIHNVDITAEGYAYCKSSIYAVLDIMDKTINYHFTTGINILIGEIDSGNWATSYLLSMYRQRRDDFILLEKPRVVVNGLSSSIEEVSEYICYMDALYPLFNTKVSTKTLVGNGIKQNNIRKSVEEIGHIFHIDSERFERPITGSGNEKFRAMASIGYSYGKQIFCFPWMSRRRFDAYQGQMEDLMNIMESLKMVVILPIGD